MVVLLEKRRDKILKDHKKYFEFIPIFSIRYKQLMINIIKLKNKN